MHRMHLAKPEQGSYQLGLLLIHWLHVSQSSYLNKHSSISVGMRMDGPGSMLPTRVASEGHQHLVPRQFCEEQPRVGAQATRSGRRSGCHRNWGPSGRAARRWAGGAFHRWHVCECGGDKVFHPRPVTEAGSENGFHHRSYSPLWSPTLEPVVKYFHRRFHNN
jgi:hypothetical protein